MRSKGSIAGGAARALQISVLAFVVLVSLAMPFLPRASAATHSVSIVNLAFQPDYLLIEQGDTVIWTNTVSTLHTTTADGVEWDSGTMSKDETFSHTFNTLGIFAYACSFHPSMTGTVEVVQVIPEFSGALVVVLGMLVIVLGMAVLGRRRQAW